MARLSFLFASLFVLPALAGCITQNITVDDENRAIPSIGGSGQDIGEGTTTTVRIRDFVYNPSALTVRQGGTVTWVNDDTVPHTVTGNGFDSGQIAPGGSFTFRFPSAGTFSYYCSIHPAMAGTVTVQDGLSPAGSPSGRQGPSGSEGLPIIVELKNQSFSLQALAINEGTTVVFDNDDTIAHAITGPGIVDSGAIYPGGSYPHTFMQEGTYVYRLALYPENAITITVQRNVS
ncbi:MAG TPA: hypothetical protein HA254_05040 [Candidatus Diapherotrites archaeon]|uniref:Blue (type 1) copper domain-containing protein n=1 Tax=Candidatus Iainarchaeum sp. TaxID=3101447 RepID=A0A7J4IYS0_9ARCH|nr:hypothetical protein [Candidatus Diapherotrites archaeon]